MPDELGVLAAAVGDGFETLDDCLELMERLVVGIHVEHAAIEFGEDIVRTALEFVHKAGQLDGFCGRSLPMATGHPADP